MIKLKKFILISTIITCLAGNIFPANTTVGSDELFTCCISSIVMMTPLTREIAQKAYQEIIHATAQSSNLTLASIAGTTTIILGLLSYYYKQPTQKFGKLISAAILGGITGEFLANSYALYQINTPEINTPETTILKTDAINPACNWLNNQPDQAAALEIVNNTLPRWTAEGFPEFLTDTTEQPLSKTISETLTAIYNCKFGIKPLVKLPTPTTEKPLPLPTQPTLIEKIMTFFSNLKNKAQAHADANMF